MAVDLVPDNGKLRNLLESLMDIKGTGSFRDLHDYIISIACRLCDSPYGVIAQFDRDGQSVSHASVFGLSDEHRTQVERQTVPAEFLTSVGDGMIFDSGSTLPLVDIPTGHPRVSSFLVKPIAGNADKGRGVIILAGRNDGQSFDHDDLGLVTLIARVSAVWMNHVMTRNEQEKMKLVAERERVARDMHDTVIHRIFGSALLLQNLLTSLGEDNRQLADTLSRVVSELDSTIMDIRTTIFELDSFDSSVTVTDRFADISRELRSRLGIDATVVVAPGVDDEIVPDAAREMFTALREALANIARHAHATKVHISVTLLDRVLLLTVEDNGVGLTTGDGAGRGIRNLNRRAAENGGYCTIAPGSRGGTLVTWSIANGEMK